MTIRDAGGVDAVCDALLLRCTDEAGRGDGDDGAESGSNSSSSSASTSTFAISSVTFLSKIGEFGEPLVRACDAVVTAVDYFASSEAIQVVTGSSKRRSIQLCGVILFKTRPRLAPLPGADRGVPGGVQPCPGQRPQRHDNGGCWHRAAAGS